MNKRIGFGGGCHWCTEAVFASLEGVNKVQQGFIKSIAPFENYSEAVIVSFDSEIISLKDLVEIHLHTHASTSMHSMRNKYRSAVYYFNDKQKQKIQNMFEILKPQFDQTLVTGLIPFVQFNSSLRQYKNYYYANPQKPFCKLYIHPKIQFLKQKYAKHINMQK